MKPNALFFAVCSLAVNAEVFKVKRRKINFKIIIKNPQETSIKAPFLDQFTDLKWIPSQASKVQEGLDAGKTKKTHFDRSFTLFWKMGSRVAY